MLTASQCANIRAVPSSAQTPAKSQQHALVPPEVLQCARLGVGTVARGGSPVQSGPVSQPAICDLGWMSSEWFRQGPSPLPSFGFRTTLTWHKTPKICQDPSGIHNMGPQSDAASAWRKPTLHSTDSSRSFRLYKGCRSPIPKTQPSWQPPSPSRSVRQPATCELSQMPHEQGRGSGQVHSAPSSGPRAYRCRAGTAGSHHARVRPLLLAGLALWGCFPGTTLCLRVQVSGFSAQGPGTKPLAPQQHQSARVNVTRLRRAWSAGGCLGLHCSSRGLLQSDLPLLCGGGRGHTPVNQDQVL